MKILQYIKTLHKTDNVLLSTKACRAKDRSSTDSEQNRKFLFVFKASSSLLDLLSFICRHSNQLYPQQPFCIATITYCITYCIAAIQALYRALLVIFENRAWSRGFGRWRRMDVYFTSLYFLIIIFSLTFFYKVYTNNGRVL